MSAERNNLLLTALSQQNLFMTEFLKALKQEENGESQSIVLRAQGAPDLTQSAAPDVIVIDDDDEEEASQGSSSVEQAQTGRPFSGEASRERVHPSSRFFLTSNTFRLGTPARAIPSTSFSSVIWYNVMTSASPTQRTTKTEFIKR